MRRRLIVAASMGLCAAGILPLWAATGEAAKAKSEGPSASPLTPKARTKRARPRITSEMRSTLRSLARRIDSTRRDVIVEDVEPSLRVVGTVDDDDVVSFDDGGVLEIEGPEE